MFVGRYTTRPAQLSVKRELESEGRKARVYELNDLLVTVWEDGEVTANRAYRSSSDIKQALPNMSFCDGEIRLPIEDLVAFILQRITPLELAEGIIADDEARSALIDKLAERYNTPGFEDVDRRQFLTKVQQQVYAASVDRVVGYLNDRESNERSRSDYWLWKSVELGHYKSLYEKMWGLLEGDEEALAQFKMRQISPESLAETIKKERDPIVMESVGPQWHESRDYWRRRIEELFTAPEKLEEEK